MTEQTWTIDGDEYVLATGDDAHEVSATNDEILRNGTIYADRLGTFWCINSKGLHLRAGEDWEPYPPGLYTLRVLGPFRALAKVEPKPEIPGGFTVGQKVRITRNVFIDPEGQESATGHDIKGLTGIVFYAPHAPAQQRNVFVRIPATGARFAVAPTSLVPAYEAGDEVPAEHITHLPDGTLLRQRNPEANSGWLVMEGELRRIHADGALGIGNYSAFTFEDITWTVTWTPEATS